MQTTLGMKINMFADTNNQCKKGGGGEGANNQCKKGGGDDQMIVHCLLFLL